MVSIRRVLVSSLPSNPFSTIACPAMIFFVIAFYIIHTIYIIGLETIIQSQARLCSGATKYGRDILIYAGLLMGIHISGIIPNYIHKRMIEGSNEVGNGADGNDRGDAADDDDGGDEEAHEESRSIRGRSPSKSTRVIRAIYYMTLILQQLAWVSLLVAHLYLNWRAYWLIDSDADRYKAFPPKDDVPSIAFASASSPSSSSSSVVDVTDASGSIRLICGSLSSIHLLRWSLVCLTVTTAIVLSLLLQWCQDTFAAVRTRIRRSHRSLSAPVTMTSLMTRRRTVTTKRSTTTTTLRSWLDLQTDEVNDDADEDERMVIDSKEEHV